MGKDAGILLEYSDYLQYERGYSLYTVDGYLRDVRRFFRIIYGDSAVGEVVAKVTPRDVRLWVLEDSQAGRAARSVNRSLSALKGFFDFCRERGLVAQNPVSPVGRPKAEKRLPQFFRVEEMERLLDPANYPDDWEGGRDRFLILLLYSSGIRRSELVGLRWGDWDRHAQTIRVFGKGRRERIVPVMAELGRELEGFRLLCERQLARPVAPEDPLVMMHTGAPMGVGHVYRCVNACYARLTTGSCSGPHALRHTFATHMLGGGADIGAIKELLGHASLASTQVYAHTDVEMLKSVYKHTHPHGD